MQNLWGTLTKRSLDARPPIPSPEGGRTPMRADAPTRSPSMRGGRRQPTPRHGLFLRQIVLMAAVCTVLATPALAAPTLVVSIDGLAHRFVDAHKARMPVLQKLIAGGYFNRLISTFPSMTWAAHATMVTGLRPGEHGVVGNRWLDHATGKAIEAWEVPMPIQARTIWAAAADAKLKVAAIQWPNTSGERRITWNIPEVYGKAYDSDISGPARQELAAIGYKAEDLKTFADEEAFLMDNQSRDLAVRLWGAQDVDLMLLHFLAVDTVAHKYGPDHPAVGIAAEYVDRMLGDVLTAAQRSAKGKQLNVIVVSDHGFLAINNWIKTNALVDGAPVTAANRSRLRVLHNGHCAYVYGLAPNDRAAYAAWASKKVKGFDQVIEPRNYASYGFAQPSLSPDSRVPDLIVVAKPDTLFVSPLSRSQSKGGHGYLPTVPELSAVMVRQGPAFKTALPTSVNPDMTLVAQQIGLALGIAFAPKAGAAK